MTTVTIECPEGSLPTTFRHPNAHHEEHHSDSVANHVFVHPHTKPKQEYTCEPGLSGVYGGGGFGTSLGYLRTTEGNPVSAAIPEAPTVLMLILGLVFLARFGYKRVTRERKETYGLDPNKPWRLPKE